MLAVNTGQIKIRKTEACCWSTVLFPDGNYPLRPMPSISAPSPPCWDRKTRLPPAQRGQGSDPPSTSASARAAAAPPPSPSPLLRPLADLSLPAGLATRDP